ncbi:AIPR family protein [Bradyrhizobium sp. Pa8]|uniref:AIPR family protein n=1 Tax=Bradyrhizobium sp. Pa8 TaxID=3386552 RepID=UPI00403F6549
MATNEAIVLRTNFESWQRRADGLDADIDPWLYYCLEQHLKSYAIDDDDLEAGITDSGHDGGIDGYYFLVNNRQVVDADSDLDPKMVSSIHLLFFQVKHSGGMRPTEIEKWLETVDDFFDLSKDPSALEHRYNFKIRTAMRVWREQFLKFSVHFPSVSVSFFYITGDDAAPDGLALDACNRVKLRVERAIKSTCKVNCVGAKQLWEQVQKRPLSHRVVRWAENPMQTKEGYVGLVRLHDFREFLIEDEDPNVLAERIFESNVRGFVVDSTINEEMMNSLRNPDGEPNFWLLNNGVTVIAAKTLPSHLMVTVSDPQIVNGLQTSRVIFDTIKPGTKDDRTVLVRVIETTDQRTQDRIIKATNSQNKMQAASLRMTDQIHRDIEQHFRGEELFYDRRKGFYKDQGQPIKRIVSVNAVAQAIISIILQRPDDARARPGDYFKEENRYRSIFATQKVPLPTYLACVRIVRHVASYMSKRTALDKRDSNNLLYYVVAMAVREYTGLKMPVASRLPRPDQLKDDLLLSTLRNVQRFYFKLLKAADSDLVARGPVLLKRLDAQWDRKKRNAKKAG